MFLHFLIITLSSFVFVQAYAPLREPSPLDSLNSAALMKAAMERIDYGDKDGQFFDLGSRLDGLNTLFSDRRPKDVDILEGGADYDLHFPSIRDHEYLQQSNLNNLWGSKFISGGGSEIQKIKGIKAQAEIKTDAILPAYCNPPNPCPVGQTAEDGCIENFENSAGFSRAYQASQECMCDTEHMFDCQPSQGSGDTELEQTRNDFLTDLERLSRAGGEHKSVMAKKFYNHDVAREQHLNKLEQLAKDALAKNYHQGVKLDQNPFLVGEKLPIAAKKGNFGKTILH